MNFVLVVGIYVRHKKHLFLLESLIFWMYVYDSITENKMKIIYISYF